MASTGQVMAPNRTRRRAWAVFTLLVITAAVVAAVVLTNSGGRRARGAHRALAATATVERRNLVTSENATGKITYAGASTVTDQLQGTLTWVPAVGRVIKPGQRLFDVNNFPVILLDGTTPAYRTLDASDSDGPDIQQLNENLVRLGLDPEWIADNDEWQPGTTAGVEAFQEANDEPVTGSLQLGTFEFLPGARRVSSVQGAAAAASYTPGEAVAEFVDDRTATRQLHQQVKQLQRQERQLAKKLAAAQAQARNAEPAYAAGSPVMTTTSTNLVVTVDVTAGEQSVTRVGARVPVMLPSGTTVHGHVVRIGQVGTSSGGSAKVPITIHLDAHEDGRDLDQATVDVRFVEKTARHALSVPVTALLAQPGGRYAIQEAGAPHRLIDVRLGTFATGYVQVSGEGLHPGLKITDAQG